MSDDIACMCVEFFFSPFKKITNKLHLSVPNQ